MSYPQLLKEIPDAPKRLYVRGLLRLEKSFRWLGVVGSRNMTTYGKDVLQKIFDELSSSARSRMVTVSGFTRGVDMFVHNISIQLGLPTVAVLPCGFDSSYLSQQKETYFRVLDCGGALVTEYAPKEEPKKWTFVQRNRIIAGLSAAVLVVEAGVSSGSLLTAKFATRYNRKLCVIPGDIFRWASAGICQLLESGAIPIHSGRQIEKLLGIEEDIHIPIARNIPNATFSNRILNVLFKRPADAGTLAAITKLHINAVLIELSKLEIEGRVASEMGVYRVR